MSQQRQLSALALLSGWSSYLLPSGIFSREPFALPSCTLVHAPLFAVQISHTLFVLLLLYLIKYFAFAKLSKCRASLNNAL